MESGPLVSIVTPSLNQRRFLEAAIESVVAQSYPRIEHIVVDGGSTDNTVEVLRRYEQHLRWISEPDDGQSDALAKGFAVAGGEVFAWLNADDVYLPGAVAAAVAALAETGAGLVYGGWQHLDEDGTVLREIRPRPFDYREQLERRNLVPQPAAFFTREAFEAAGGIDRRLHYAMDYDLWLRIAERFPVETIDRPLAGFRLHRSSKTVAHADRFSPEVIRVSRRRGGRRWSPMYVDFYLPRHRPSLYRLVLAWRLVRAGDLRGVAERVHGRLRRR